MLAFLLELETALPAVAGQGMRRRTSSIVLAAALLAAPVVCFRTAVVLAQQGGEESPPNQPETEQAIANLVRDIQRGLQAASSAGFLGKIDTNEFNDYPRFRQMVEQLTRQNSLRVFFRQLSSVLKQDTAQTVLDAEMELTRKDSAGQIEIRREQLTVDLARTSRGWKIVNIRPRDFFRPL